MQQNFNSVATMYSRNTEIRHLSSADVYNLSHILEPMQFWKKLMRIIPKDLNSKGERVELKYNAEHMRLIEHATAKDGRACTEILFDEWGCSGRIRPTIGKLLELLIKAELFRAADFVAVNFLNETPPTRPLKGPAAKVDISIPLDPKDEKDVENALRDISYPGTATLMENKVVASDLNNQDYYEKLGLATKRLDIVHSDLMKFSEISENIPNLSELEMKSSTYNVHMISITNATGPVNVENIPNLSALNINDEIEDSNDKSSSNVSSIIPNLSIFEESDFSKSSLEESEKTNDISFVSSESIGLDNVPCLSALKN